MLSTFYFVDKCTILNIRNIRSSSFSQNWITFYNLRPDTLYCWTPRKFSSPQPFRLNFREIVFKYILSYVYICKIYLLIKNHIWYQKSFGVKVWRMQGKYIIFSKKLVNQTKNSTENIAITFCPRIQICQRSGKKALYSGKGIKIFPSIEAGFSWRGSGGMAREFPLLSTTLPYK